MPGTKPITPPRGFTPKSIEALQPAADRYELADRRTPGLRLRVHPSGVKSFRWYVTSLGRVITIGPWSMCKQPGFVTLKQAQDWLERLKEAHVGGTVPAVEAELRAFLRVKSAPGSPIAAPQVVTVSVVAEQFYQRRILPHRKVPLAVRHVLDADVLPALGALPVDALTTRECAAVVERVVDRGAKVHAGKVLAILKQLLRFAQARGHTDRNPAAPLEPKDLGVESNVSDRWLTEEEIPLFWRALDRERSDPHPDKNGKVQTWTVCTPTTRAGLRLLLLTGVRTGELLKAQWEQVDLDEGPPPEKRRPTWTIPVANQKLTRDQERKAKPFVIPLSPTAVALFKDLKSIAEGVRIVNEHGDKVPSPWVMASSEAEDGHFTDKSLGRATRRLFQGSEKRPALLTLPGGPCSPHDLRRSMRTHLGKLRVPLHVVERCLNHSLGRIVQTYDQGDYIDERREALERWDAYLQRLLTGESNVVVLPAGVRAAG